MATKKKPLHRQDPHRSEKTICGREVIEFPVGRVLAPGADAPADRQVCTQCRTGATSARRAAGRWPGIPGRTAP